MAAGEVEVPKFWMSCGTADSLYAVDRSFYQEICDAGFACEWDEAPNGHDWDFWDGQIKKVIDWLPLGEADATLGSGNVSGEL